jgi:hypothetical protein
MAFCNDPPLLEKESGKSIQEACKPAFKSKVRLVVDMGLGGPAVVRSIESRALLHTSHKQ